MGVVFRARDTALQRDVALKLLPDRFTGDPDRLGRFQREAQILASLNHPNIAQIYGLEQSAAGSCIVMELVAGETLARRIQHGPIPVEEALQLARQIADALESAHDRGVVHRDLKPANIIVTPEGKVKVLDFGLAKIFANDDTNSDPSQSPTTITGATGVILGTAAYMAPEQARGRPVDKRADIWAFGCILFEMLTGGRAFEGESVTEILGAVMHKEPDCEQVPSSVKSLVRRCLEKDPKRRLRDIADANALLEVSQPAIRQERQANRVTMGSRIPWVVAAIFLVVSIVLAMYFTRKAPDVPVVRFQVAPPSKTEYAAVKMSLSPDGRRMAFIAQGADNIQRLWVHNLDTVESQLLAGTEGVTGAPFWSPNGQFLAFGVRNQLKKIDLSGGQPQTLCTSTTSIGGGVWNERDILLFGGPPGAVLQKVPASGGIPAAVTSFARQSGTFHAFPSFLPDGTHFLYYVAGAVEVRGVYVGSLEAKPEEQGTTRLLDSPTNAVFALSKSSASGLMLFMNGTTLMSQPFDTKNLTLTGQATPIAEQVASANGVLGLYSVSDNGVLSYRTATSTAMTPVLVDRNGRELTALTTAPLELATNPRFSPDGKRFAIRSGTDIWVYDLQGRPPFRLTFGGSPLSPLWTRDGKRLVYEINDPQAVLDASGKPLNVQVSSLVSLPADGSGNIPEPASPAGHFHALAWSLDGLELIATQYVSRASTDVVSFEPQLKSTVKPLVQTPAAEGTDGLDLSPDGRWLAYSSDTTGTVEIWVRPYAQQGAPVRVSPNGGKDPVWSKNTQELFYFEGNRLMSVEVNTKAEFNFKPATKLFDVPYFVRVGQPPHYDVAPDGRFLLLRPANPTLSPITVILNWKR
jgi:serine/threonine protein kinase